MNSINKFLKNLKILDVFALGKCSEGGAFQDCLKVVVRKNLISCLTEFVSKRIKLHLKLQQLLFHPVIPTAKPDYVINTEIDLILLQRRIMKFANLMQ